MTRLLANRGVAETRRRSRRLAGVGFVALAAAISVGVAVLAETLSPVLLGATVGAGFVVGWLLLRVAGRAALLRRSAAEEESLEELVSALLQQGGPGWRNHLPCYLTVQDVELRIVEMNDRFRDEFGDAVGSHCYFAYKGRESPCPDCPVLRTLADGHTHRSEEQVVNDSGEVETLVVTSVPLRNRRGELVAVMEMSTNTSELETVQRELDRSRHDFERLFDLVPCYISIQDRDFRIVETNELFRRDFGEQSGVRCYRAYKGRDSVCPDCPIEKTLLDGEIHSSEESVVTRDGHQASVMAYSMPIRNAHGEIEAVMEVSANITEVKQLQHQLAMMGLAVAGMAHRIKNILMGLEGGVYIINDGFETGEQESVAQGWGMVQRNVARIAAVVKDLLYCSKDRDPEFVEGVRPAEILREVAEMYRSRTEEDGIDLKVEADQQLVATLAPEGVHSLVANLVANAIDACRFDTTSDKRHAITMRCRRGPGDAVVIEVADNGGGIPADVHHKVFKGFFSTKGTEGTGLGLLVVQKTVAEHGGTISFASKEGDGTTFTAVLPAHP